MLSRSVQKKCPHQFELRPFHEIKASWAYECILCGAKSRSGIDSRSRITSTYINVETGQSATWTWNPHQPLADQPVPEHVQAIVNSQHSGIV
jgi:hypothetical protein